MIKLIGNALYQWDSGRKVKIVPHMNTRVDCVHFSNGMVANVSLEENCYTANIPNALLQKDGLITIYAVMITSEDVRTTESRCFIVHKKTKPDDYVYTEVEVFSFTSLSRRIDVMEQTLASGIEEWSANATEEFKTFIEDVQKNADEIDETIDDIYDDINFTNDAVSSNTNKIKTNSDSIRQNAMSIGMISSYMPLIGMKILCLGDSIMGNDQGDGKTEQGVPSYLAEYSGATVYNGGLGGSCMAVRTNGTENNCFDLPNLLNAKISGTWTNQDTQAESLGKTGTFYYYPNTINMLKDLNFAELDVITLAYGTNDWTNGHTLASVKAALEGAIDTIQTNYPKVRILVITPIWRYFGGNTDGDTETRYGEGFTLKEWSKKIEEFAIDKRISVLNAYENLPLSKNNAATYFDTNSSTADGLDHTHLRAEGSQMYAHLINGKLNSIF